MRRLVTLLLMVVLGVGAGFFLWSPKRGAGSEAERNRIFTESMSGVTLVGHSTMLNREGLSKEESYAIDGVSHMTGDTWLFRARLKYGEREIPVPIPLSVKWAGDTPVITLTDLAIPGVGTFTARVVLYRDQYAGTWSGKDEGGQLFGRIVRAGRADPKAALRYE
jgi:hypothetical protein